MIKKLAWYVFFDDDEGGTIIFHQHKLGATIAGARELESDKRKPQQEPV